MLLILRKNNLCLRWFLCDFKKLRIRKNINSKRIPARRNLKNFLLHLFEIHHRKIFRTNFSLSHRMASCLKERLLIALSTKLSFQSELIRAKGFFT
jgi:hypothetical protein